MKLKLRNIVTGLPALQSLSSMMMSIQLAFTLQRIMRFMQPDYEAYEASRIEMIKTRFGVKLPDGNFEVKQDKLKEFSEEIEKLLDSDIFLDIRTISLEEAKDLKVSPSILYNLDWLFVDTKELPSDV